MLMRQARFRWLTCWLTVGALLLTLSHWGQAQDTLESLRHNVRAEKEPEAPPRKRRRRSPRVRETDDETDNFVGQMLALGVTLPFWGPPIILDDNYREHGRFFSYPYKRGAPGNLVIGPEHQATTKVWHLRARSEYLESFSGVSSTGGQVLLDTLPRFGLDTEFYHRQEMLQSGSRDTLWTGDANAVFRFAQSSLLQMRTGLGINWLSDEQGREYGFNFTYGGDLMLGDPWILSGEIDAGTLGNSGLFHGRVTVGAQFHHVEIYTGYDYYQVGDTILDGALVGVRLWF